MFLLDTDILVWVLRDNKKIIQIVSNLKEKSTLSISVISIAEIYKNIFPAEIEATEEYLNKHAIFNVNQKIAKIAGFYYQQYSKNLQNLSLADCLIAATANVNNATLVSLNKKHFPMKDIKLLDPLS